MNLAEFAVVSKWPPRHPDRIQLYSLTTPNGVKASVMLEETALPYEPHLVRFDRQEQLSTEYRTLNPYGKIPSIIDPHGPDGAPLALFESGAILIYLAEKSGRLLPSGAARYETLKWLCFQAAGVGPMFGQVGFFVKFEGKDWEDKRPRDRYIAESRKLLGVLNGQLAERQWIACEEYTIADVATFPLVRNLLEYYGAGDLVGVADFPHVMRAFAAFMARPAVQRAIHIPARDAGRDPR